MRKIEKLDATPANDDARSRFDARRGEYRRVLERDTPGLDRARRELKEVEYLLATRRFDALKEAEGRLNAQIDAWENAIIVRLAENFLADADMHLEAGVLAIAAQDRAQILRHRNALYDECTSHDPEKQERLPVARNRWRQLVCLAYHAGLPRMIQRVAEWA